MSKRSISRTSKSQQSPRSAKRKSRASERCSATGRFVPLKGPGTLNRDVSSKKVSPTSERIIKEISVKRRKAMQVLANR